MNKKDKKNYTNYTKLSWPDYQVYMEEHEDEWYESTGLLEDPENSVLVPTDWITEHETQQKNKKLIEIEKELIKFFKGSRVVEFLLMFVENNENNVIIIPTNSDFDEDYGGEYDEKIDKIGKKYGVSLSLTSDIYGK